MPLYFTYGSNMHRARIERRVGKVRDLGRARLAGFRHVFNKHGRDGTAKGNIVADLGSEVQGVLYELTDAQLEQLAVLEGGYRRVVREVEHLPADALVSAVTFEAIAPVTGLRPTAAYLAFYEHGMIEHELPADYRARILAEGRGAR